MDQQGEDITVSMHVPRESHGEDAYCTLLMSDSYLPGAQVLAHSLRDAGTKKKLAVLVTFDSLSASTIAELDKLYDYIIPVERIVNKTPANLYLMNRGDLTSTFTKINLWRQRRFRKIVYLDADVVALRAPDELFDIKEEFAAAPDIGWPDCFNSGVLVLKPNMADFYSLLALAQRGVSFDGADQGLLNMHFRNYHRISFRYNCTPSSHYQYVPAYRHFQSETALLHFIGKNKPWFMGRDTPAIGGVYNELLGRWWAVHDRHFRVSNVESPTEQPRSEPRFSSSNGGPSHKARKVPHHVKDTIVGQERSPLPPDSAKIEAPLHEESVSSDPVNIDDGPPHSDATVIENIETVAINPTEPDAPPIITPREEPFIAPQSDWDPTKSAPPINSRPEAPNFPQQTYKMSQDPVLFKPPASYPDPPKDLSYEVPKPAPVKEPLKPLFPWELKAPKPTRVFPKDNPPSPSKTVISPPSGVDDETQVDDASLTTPIAQVSSPVPWQNYTMTNAWDEIPEIEQFISAMTQHRKGKLQVLGRDSIVDDVASPGGKRPSMRLTDFPTEIERPSLPVTPAPVRPTFWGSERNEEGELPAAEGVPRQEDWDPSAKLEELCQRRAKVLPKLVKDDSSKETTEVSPGKSARHSADPVSPSGGVATPVEETSESPTRETTPLSGGLDSNDEASSRIPTLESEPKSLPGLLPLLDSAITTTT